MNIASYKNYLSSRGNNLSQVKRIQSDKIMNSTFTADPTYKKVYILTKEGWKWEDAKYQLQRFRKELSDVNGNFNLQLDVGGFLSFADFFFDGILADYLVQSKINDARRQVDDAIIKVQRILDDLKRMQV